MSDLALLCQLLSGDSPVLCRTVGQQSGNSWYLYRAGFFLPFCPLSSAIAC